MKKIKNMGLNISDAVEKRDRKDKYASRKQKNNTKQAQKDFARYKKCKV